MSRCINCSREISDEEFRARYEELSRQGIVPMMVPICAECRRKANDKAKK